MIKLSLGQLLFFFLFYCLVCHWTHSVSSFRSKFSFQSLQPGPFDSICPQTWVFYQNNLLPSPLILIQPTFFSCLDPWKDAVVVTQHQGNAKISPTTKATTTTRQCFVFSLLAVRQTLLVWTTWANTSLKQSLRMSRSVSVVLRCRKVRLNAPV